jgi:toxin-antitoxin system PIN domain toxin
VIALDTNVLVYAHREDSAHHAAALTAVERLVTGPSSVGVPWPVVHEFLAVVTHPQIYQPASTMAVASAAMSALLGAPKVHVLGEGSDHFAVLTRLLEAGPVAGPRVHDARVAAICLTHGAEALWSADRDFTWFPELKVVNPLVG